jgi:hypothetical protein
VLDLSFVAGLALGTIVTGFLAIGSFNRGFDSVRRTSWSRELAARKRAVVSSQVAARAVSHRDSAGALSKAS